MVWKYLDFTELTRCVFWRWRYYLTISGHFAYRDWEKIKPNSIPFKPSNNGRISNFY